MIVADQSINSTSKMVSVVFICHMRFPENIPTLQDNGIGNMYFLRPNGLEILVLVNKVGIISMKQLSKNLLKGHQGCRNSQTCQLSYIQTFICHASFRRWI